MVYVYVVFDFVQFNSFIIANVLSCKNELISVNFVPSRR